jgi:two-component system cell cycle response regulator DivK
MCRVGQKILVVEDNELNLKLFCDLLRAHGYAAEPVRDGREAVARARDFQPDLIVMDIQMPHISGLELIEQMKGDAELRRVPIMAVTAYAAKGDEERIREAGAEGYVSKPISVVRFVEAVRALLAAPRPEPAVSRVAGGAGASRQPPRGSSTPGWTSVPSAAGCLSRPSGEMVRVALDGRPGGRFEIVERRGGRGRAPHRRLRGDGAAARLAFTLQVPSYSPAASGSESRHRACAGGCELTLVQSVSPGRPASAEQIEKRAGRGPRLARPRLEREGEEG